MSCDVIAYYKRSSFHDYTGTQWPKFLTAFPWERLFKDLCSRGLNGVCMRTKGQIAKINVLRNILVCIDVALRGIFLLWWKKCSHTVWALPHLPELPLLYMSSHYRKPSLPAFIDFQSVLSACTLNLVLMCLSLQCSFKQLVWCLPVVLLWMFYTTVG